MIIQYMVSMEGATVEAKPLCSDEFLNPYMRRCTTWEQGVEISYIQ